MDDEEVLHDDIRNTTVSGWLTDQDSLSVVVVFAKELQRLEK
jgi:hypothetical protein